MNEPLGSNWLTEKAKDIFREYFDEIAKELSTQISKSNFEYDRIASEEFVTKLLISIINGYSSENFNDRFGNRLKEALNGFYVHIRAWENAKAAEAKIGADLGIILSVFTENINLNKTIIIQSKKAFIENGRVIYPELKKRGMQQAKNMLKITPASFFMLYNTSEIANLDFCNTIIKDHFIKTRKANNPKFFDKCFPEDIYFFLRKRPGLLPLSFPLDILFEYLWERGKNAFSGILILPANKISSLKSVDPSLEALLPSCLSFADFMVDLFMPSFVGDTRQHILERAGANSNLTKRIFTKYTTKISVSRG